MNITNYKSELTAIVNLCNGISDVKTYLLGSLNQEYFGIPEILEIFNRIFVVIKKGRDIPSIKLISLDMTLSDEAKELLSGYKNCPKLKTVDEAAQLMDILNTYRISRICFNCSDKSLKLLEQETVDVNKVIVEYEKAVLDARKIGDSEEELIHIGYEGNSEEIVNKIINGKITSFVPTGFNNFDKINGGFRRKGLVVIAATTSGGKSAMALQLLINMYKTGHSVALVSLEMDMEEIFSRMLSNIADVDSIDILLNRITPEQKKKMLEKWEEFNNIGKRKNCRFSLYTPSRDVTIEDVTYGLERFKFDVLIVDYISLLSDSTGDDSWRRLGEIARFMKIFSKSRDMVGVLLCQLSDEYKVKYSRTIVEHANNVLSWVYNKDIAQENNHVITIKQQKARNQQIFDFNIREDFSRMRLTDYIDNTNDEVDLSKRKDKDIEIFDEQEDLENY